MFILCSDKKDVQRALRHKKNSNAFIYLQNQENHEIETFLCKEGFTYLDKFEILGDQKEILKKDVRSFFARLNNHYNTLEWWALTFTSKSPLTNSNLIYQILHYLGFIELFKKEIFSPYELIVVIVEEKSLKEQVKQWLVFQSIHFKDYACIKNSRSFLFRLLPIDPTLIFVKSLFLKLFSMMILRPSFEKEKYTAILSLISPVSFLKDHYRDVYFGKLHDYFKHKGKPYFVLGVMASPLKALLKQIRKHQHQVLIVPHVYFCSWKDLLVCYFRVVKRFYYPFPFKQSLSLYENPVDILFRNAEREEVQTKRFFVELICFYVGRGLVQKGYVQKLFYPCENRSWEKTLILGIKGMSFQNEVEVIGYQHASLSERHWNYSLEEKEICPFPDRILTNGEKTYQWLKKSLHLNPSNIEIACSLRYQYDDTLVKRRTCQKILVALGSPFEEYQKIFDFLNRVKLEDIDLILRPHQLFSLEESFRRMKPHFSYRIDTHSRLEDSLKEVDCVTYASSTAAIEALALGIPVIYLDLPDFCNSDPIWDCSDFKWAVKKPIEFLQVLSHIKELSDDEYVSMQKKARVYVNQYFYPVCEQTLTPFL